VIAQVSALRPHLLELGLDPAARPAAIPLAVDPTTSPEIDRYHENRDDCEHDQRVEPCREDDRRYTNGVCVDQPLDPDRGSGGRLVGRRVTLRRRSGIVHGENVPQTARAARVSHLRVPHAPNARSASRARATSPRQNVSRPTRRVRPDVLKQPVLHYPARHRGSDPVTPRCLRARFDPFDTAHAIN
jgi:hypothetical protein